MYWSRAFANSVSLAAKRLMISSGVMSLGGVFSSGPSWASTNGDANPQASNVRQRADTSRITSSLLVYRIENWRGDATSDVSWRDHQGDSKLRPRKKQDTAATLPSNPSPLSEAGGRVLQFCHYFGCLFE